jgi:hypothetical protein
VREELLQRAAHAISTDHGGLNNSRSTTNNAQGRVSARANKAQGRVTWSSNTEPEPSSDASASSPRCCP